MHFNQFEMLLNLIGGELYTLLQFYVNPVLLDMVIKGIFGFDMDSSVIDAIDRDYKIMQQNKDKFTEEELKAVEDLGLEAEQEARDKNWLAKLFWYTFIYSAICTLTGTLAGVL